VPVANRSEAFLMAWKGRTVKALRVARDREQKAITSSAAELRAMRRRDIATYSREDLKRFLIPFRVWTRGIRALEMLAWVEHDLLQLAMVLPGLADKDLLDCLVESASVEVQKALLTQLGNNLTRRQLQTSKESMDKLLEGYPQVEEKYHDYLRVWTALTMEGSRSNRSATRGFER
jgi:hypothetical protein